MLAAQESAFEWLFEALRTASAEQAEPGAKLRAVVAAVLGFTADRPDEARLLLVETIGSDRELALRALDYHQRLANLMCSECKGPAAAGPGLTEQALVGAAAALIGTCVATERMDELPELEEPRVEFLQLAFC
jgi:hypothetical protein